MLSFFIINALIFVLLFVIWGTFDFFNILIKLIFAVMVVWSLYYASAIAPTPEIPKELTQEKQPAPDYSECETPFGTLNPECVKKIDGK